MIWLVPLAAIAFLASGLALAYVIGGATVLAFLATDNARYLAILPQKVFSQISVFALMAMPLFILAGELMNRGGVTKALPTIGEALYKVQASNGRGFVLADFGDNAGGGAPADATYALREVLDRGIKDVAFGLFWDPHVVRTCHEAGVGARLRVRVGGKVGETSGDPVDLTLTVRGLTDSLPQRLGETGFDAGAAAWIEADGVHIVVNDRRCQMFSPDGFTALGLDISGLKAMVVKSMNHFYAQFAPVSTEVIHVATPGTTTADLTGIVYTKRDGNYWPRVADPFAEGA